MFSLVFLRSVLCLSVCLSVLYPDCRMAAQNCLSVCLSCTANIDWLHRTLCLSVLYPDCRMAAQNCLSVCLCCTATVDWLQRTVCLSACLCCTPTSEWLRRTVCLSVLYRDCRMAAQNCLPVCAVPRLSTGCTEMSVSLCCTPLSTGCTEMSACLCCTPTVDWLHRTTYFIGRQKLHTENPF